MTTQTLKNWQEDKIGNLLLKVKRQKKVKRDDYLIKGLYPVIDQGDDLIGGYTENADNLFNGDLPAIIFGDHTRRFKWVNFPFAIGADGTQILVPKENLDRRFFFYALKAAPLKNYGYQRHFKYLKDVQIEFPDKKGQEKIANILSTYDDLIENNTRRIHILEQMAQAIYTEWFVNFRFPGHEKIKMIDSGTEFGKIPEGWKIGKLSDLANITMGQSPSSDFYNESGEGLPFHQGVTNFGFRFPTTGTFSTGGTRRANTGDILFSVRAPVGRINVADKDMIIGRGLSAMRSTLESQSYLLYALKNLFATEDLIGGGAIFASVTRADLNNFPVVIPDVKVISLFEELASPFDGLIFNLSRNLSILRHSRDLILPKLVAGEIEVK